MVISGPTDAFDTTGVTVKKSQDGLLWLLKNWSAVADGLLERDFDVDTDAVLEKTAVTPRVRRTHEGNVAPPLISTPSYEKAHPRLPRESSPIPDSQPMTRDTSTGPASTFSVAEDEEVSPHTTPAIPHRQSRETSSAQLIQAEEPSGPSPIVTSRHQRVPSIDQTMSPRSVPLPVSPTTTRDQSESPWRAGSSKFPYASPRIPDVPEEEGEEEEEPPYHEAENEATNTFADAPYETYDYEYQQDLIESSRSSGSTLESSLSSSGDKIAFPVSADQFSDHDAQTIAFGHLTPEDEFGRLDVLTCIWFLFIDIFRFLC
jgi:hypothetical protein